MAETITLPGFVDAHVHFREPGDNHAETIGNGSKAALLGGFVVVADMPNNPGHPTWTAERLEEKRMIANRDAYIPLGFYAGSQPESDNIGELEKMSKLAVGLKLYGAPTTGNENDYRYGDFREIIKEWHRVAPGKPILFHVGKNNLEPMIAKTALETDHHIHICHVNDPEDVELVSRHKSVGYSVTCGVTPHHLLKNSQSRQSEGKFAEMQPPLAHQADSEKLMRQLADGEIDIIESDYAPHTKEAKWEAELSGGSCFGVPGIEQIIPLLLYQVKRGNLTYNKLVDAMSRQPARLLGIDIESDTYTKWELADYRIESEDSLTSDAGWTPYLGNLATGRLMYTKIGGQTVVNEGLAIKTQQKTI